MPGRNRRNRMQEICSYGSVGEPVGNHRLYPEASVRLRSWGFLPKPTRLRGGPARRCFGRQEIIRCAAHCRVKRFLLFFLSMNLVAADVRRLILFGPAV